MKHFLILIISVTFFLCTPLFARAADISFVPLTGIWFSSQSVVPGDTIKIYTVVINNVYPSVNVEIAFYDNGNELGRSTIEKLAKEQAQQLWINWTPSAGAHKITARFTRAIVTTLENKSITLDPAQLNTIAESQIFNLSSSQTGVNGQASLGSGQQLSQNVDTLVGDGITVQVNKEGNNLVFSTVPANYNNGIVLAKDGSLVTGAVQQVTVSSKAGDIVTSGVILSSSTPVTLLIKTVDNFKKAVDVVKNAGETIRNLRDVTVSTIHQARSAVEGQQKNVELVKNSIVDFRKNRIALAWVGFISFIVLAAVLSFLSWRRNR